MNALRNLLLAVSWLFPLGARAVTVNAEFTCAATIPVTAAGYTAAGNEVAITLGFAPASGTDLTIVRNTGRAFIAGRFANLAHGQAVDLTHNAISYRFVANYHGGSGNDLVLQWGYQEPLAWGSNTAGQLGVEAVSGSNAPMATACGGALAGRTVLALSAGVSHSLAVCADGTVAAWGDNLCGQLGDDGIPGSRVPVAVSASGTLADKMVVAVAAGGSHSLALCADGTVAAWGANDHGQLGDGGTTSSSVPVAVLFAGPLSGKTAVAIAAGASHSLALCADGTIAAWGRNNQGQLGNNSLLDSMTPVAVNASGFLKGRSVVAIAAGGAHGMALCADGSVGAWGYNSHGQLGNNCTTRSSVPVATSGYGNLAGRTVVAIAAGASHSLALCADGGMAAWGYNFSGQLGNNSPFNSSVPVAVSGGGLLAGKVVTSVAAGHGHSLARCADGSVAVWGANGSGQLGNRSTSGTWVPQAVDSSGVLAGKAVAVIAGGENHTLALASWWHASSSDPYTQWLLDSLSESAMADPAMTGEAAAPAGDGISNLMKFALGLRPLDDGTASLPVTGMAEGYLTLTYRQSKQATDVTYTVEAGDALAAGSWAPATQVLSQSDAGDHWLVTVRDLVPMAGHPRRFMRLQVSR